VAEPGRLLPALRATNRVESREIADVYRRAFDRLHAADPIDRMALLHLTAQQEIPEIASRLEPSVATAWRCRWAVCKRSTPHLVFRGHSGPVTAVDMGTVDSEPVIVSGGEDGTVRLWDARTGAQRGEPLIGHTSWVTGVAIGVVDGEPVVVSGAMDNTVR